MFFYHFCEGITTEAEENLKNYVETSQENIERQLAPYANLGDNYDEAFSDNTDSCEASQITTYIFKEADESIIQQLKLIRNWNKNTKQRIKQCLFKLQPFMLQSHLRQFCICVREFLSEENIDTAPNGIQRQTVELVLFQLTELQQHTNYYRFIDNIRIQTVENIVTTIKPKAYDHKQ